MSNPVHSVGVMCFRGEDVLLIKRGKPPFKGQWSVPGGRLEDGETLREAAVREVREETGLEIALGDMFTVIEAKAEGYHFLLHDFVAEWVSGDPVAGDDAAEAAFFAPNELSSLNIWPKTRDVIDVARALRKTCEK